MSIVVEPDAVATEPIAPHRPIRRAAPRSLAVVAVIAACAAGAALRCWSPSSLWLDEAISASIASLPLHEVPTALRHDGAPPLYSFLLWAWERVVGSGTGQVRALSSVFGIAAIAAAALAGRRLAGAAGAAAAALLLASSPFAIYYSSEARMYSLVVLLVLLGFLALDAYLRVPRPSLGAAVALVTGALALTHYWSFFLLAVVAGSLLVRGLRGHRPEDVRAVGWMASGGVLFLPWLPSFVFQLRHTGTPWGRPAPLTGVLSTIVQWCGQPGSPAPALAGLLVAVAIVGACAVRIAGPRLELDLRARPPGRALAVVALLTLVLALVIGEVTGQAFALRYTSVALVPFLLLAALGIARLPGAGRTAVLVLAVCAGFAGAIPQAAYSPKTQAPVLAQALREQALPGDVVVYCPDQLGPATSRLLPSTLHQEVYPSGGPPARVDWVDYEKRNRAADPVAFVRALSQRAAGHAIWLVWQYGYRTYEGQCQGLTRALTALRGQGTTVVQSDPVYYEHASLRGWAPKP